MAAMDLDLDATLNWLDKRPAEQTSPGRLSVGQLVGGWCVEAYLGSGLSGEVYRVTHVENGGEAALKLLADDSPNAHLRFHEEVRTLKSLSGRFRWLPGFYAHGTFGARPYYVMEFLLSIELPLPRWRIAPFVLSVAHAVGQLHAAGYVHRDLKPANIMVRRDGTPVLIDLGLVKALGRNDAPKTPVPRGISLVNGRPVGVGTIDYAPPEQLLMGESSVPGDIYSLGKLARACFRGRPPHFWRVIIRQATNSDPDERFPTAAAFAAAVRHRNLPYHVAAAGGLVLCVAAAAFLLIPRGPAGQPPPAPVPAPPPVARPLPPQPPRESLVRGAGETDADFFARILPLAEKGDGEAQCLVAEAYFHGHGTELDRSRAFEWYLLAASKGLPGAMDSLGLCYTAGHGCKQNYQQAVRWYRQAAFKGHCGGMSNLGYCYLTGRGVDPDPDEGLYWIRQAAERGHAPAQTMLGECYLLGNGVEADRGQAAAWLERAAQQGSRRAADLLTTL